MSEPTKEMWEERHQPYGECESCRYETDRLKAYRNTRTYGDPLSAEESYFNWLCDLCAATFAGSALAHPGHYDHATLATICYVGNAILDALSPDSEPPTDP